MYQMIFAGGIHGVGKSTLCRKLASQLQFNYLSASELLKWNELNLTDERNKKVIDIPGTQNRLINGLRSIVAANEKYILDGHFCLFDKDGNVVKIPIETFKKIAPSLLVLVLGDPREIALRLSTRDERSYSLTDLEEIQNFETSHAKEVAIQLQIPLVVHNQRNNRFSDLINTINESFT